jgi:hypothetical protein
MRFPLIAVLLFLSLSAWSQNLDFLGMPDVRFGMKINELAAPQLLLDTSSSYTDTALYLRNTRCQMYYSKTQDHQLKGFAASKIEYEFCDSALGYVFVYVNGKAAIDSALVTLKKEFPRLGCKNSDQLNQCGLLDAQNSKMRVIVRINQTTSEMSFVLIPRTVKLRQKILVPVGSVSVAALLFLVLNNNGGDWID